MSNTTLSLLLQTSTLTCKPGNNIRSFWRSLRVHLTQMVFWENQSGLTFIFIPMFMFGFYFLLRTFMTAILNHIINLYESGEQTKAEDYCTRVSGEIPTQVYPLFPIKRERAIYSRDCQSEDKKQSKDSCEKIFSIPLKVDSWTLSSYLCLCSQVCLWILYDAVCRLDICQKIYTTGFSGQKSYTLKGHILWLLIIFLCSL